MGDNIEISSYRTLPYNAPPLTSLTRGSSVLTFMVQWLSKLIFSIYCWDSLSHGLGVQRPELQLKWTAA